MSYFLKKGFYLPFFILIFSGFMIADLLITFYRPLFLPEKTPLSLKKTTQFQMAKISSYPKLETINWFLKTGIMPEPLTLEDKKLDKKGSLDPSKAELTQLPLKLIGTIVHVNPLKSLATFSFSGKFITVKEQEELEGKIKIYFIERGRVSFLNVEENRYEYAELKEDKKPVELGFRPKSKELGPVVSDGKFNFTLKKSDVKKFTSDLTGLLKEAAMRPRRNEKGEIDGFCFSWIKGSSVFKNLGFQVKDCILGVNGEPVTNPQKALQVYNKLKDANDLEIRVMRDGQSKKFKYNIE